ncbi:MAG: cytoplasmic protein [Verrucomicrobiota bacterium]
MKQFESLRASSLYCNRCKSAMPVRERLLLVLPDKEIYDYLCTACGDSLGQREVGSSEKLMTRAAAQRARGARRSPLL